jgi:hypothetical protein
VRGRQDPQVSMLTFIDAETLTLIVQNPSRPFEAGKLREMRRHELPWPRQALADLGETTVRLRGTPLVLHRSPTRRGWRRCYGYASHQLRFKLQQATETNDEFRKRINGRALAEEEERPTTSPDVEGWFLGSEARNRGSLHSDVWKGTAAELAARGRVAVYPVSGWWSPRSSPSAALPATAAPAAGPAGAWRRSGRRGSSRGCSWPRPSIGAGRR